MKRFIKTFYQTVSGKNVPEDGRVRQTDHTESQFTVSIRHTTHLTDETVRDLLQTKYEVTQCSLVAKIIVVKD